MDRTLTRRAVLLASEGARSSAQLAGSTMLCTLLATVPRGDGHAVLVLPGWLAGDTSTAVLRAYLRLLGYRVHGWRRGINQGPTVASVTSLRNRVAQLASNSGGPVSVIGWSLGGLYALELARRNPANVRQVITLGSPVVRRLRAASSVSRAVDGLSAHTGRATALPRAWHESGSLRVPVTSVYSRTDGVVAWQRCLVPPARHRQNVEVRSSHLGLGYNVAVLYLSADRLAQPRDHWRPFTPRALVNPLFPRNRPH